MMKRPYIVLFFVLALVSSCSKDDTQPTDNAAFSAEARDALYNLMSEWYLWYQLMPSVNLDDYSDPYEMVNALRYESLDRWSFVADYDAFTASMQGSFVGHGIRMGLDDAGNARIVMIYRNSPLYPMGVRRGWIIKKINNTYLAPILLSEDGAAYSSLIGPAQAGVQNTFLFQTPWGEDSTIVSQKAAFQVNSVILYDTLNLKSGKTGYLVFDEFIEPSSDELKTAFAYFKQENVTDLILDLRYNSGGMLDVATELVSYISGLSSGTILVKSEYNDKKTTYNSTTYFKPVLYPLNLTRLVVICTRETASASEVVINGLRPFINVVCLGDTTNGKPAGMNIWGYRNKYIFAPITFRLLNSAGFGNFYEGFAPSMYVSDDITRDFGDRNEYCLREAVQYMETGGFSTKSAYIYRKSVIVSEKADFMNNTYKINLQEFNK
jgi:C-terminal processing protease CtpA/Prc